MSIEITKKSLMKYARAQRETFEAMLKEFVETPSVSAELEHAKDIARMAELGAETLRSYGAKVRIIRTEGNPIVHGVFGSSKKVPTATLYNHLDVQPASMETEPWTSEPFVFAKKGDKYLGRGTTDDKGPALTSLLGVVAAREAGVPLNIHVLWELEEEIGSPSFEKALRGNRDRLATDSIIVSDTIWVSRNQPACPAGLRGMQAFELTLTTGKTDVHSGTTGGLARNPMGELLKAVCDLYDPVTGRVKLKGFYDDVVMPTAEELDDFRGAGFSIPGFKKAHGLKSLRTEKPLDAMKRLWAMPTMEIHGVTGGYAGPGIKTVIPPEALVKVSCRLVPNQDPRKILLLVRNFLKAKYPGVKVVPENQMLPFRAPIRGPLPDAVRNSMEFAWGKRPVFVREGGSIGAVPSMEKVLGVPIVFLGLSLPEHGYHAPNENYDWRQAEGGMVAFAKYFDEVSKM